MQNIYSGSVFVQIKSPCKKRFPSPLSHHISETVQDRVQVAIDQ